MARQYKKRRLTVSSLVQKIQVLRDFRDAPEGYDNDALDNLLADLFELITKQKPGPKLSKTTHEVDRLLLEGKTPKEISERLKTSLSTVRRRQVMNRLAKEKVDGTHHVHREITEKTG